MQFGKQLLKTKNKNIEPKATATIVASKDISAATARIANHESLWLLSIPLPELLSLPTQIPMTSRTMSSMTLSFKRWHVMPRSLM